MTSKLDLNIMPKPLINKTSLPNKKLNFFNDEQHKQIKL